MFRAQTQSKGRWGGCWSPTPRALEVGGSPRGAGHQGTREAEQRAARAALKLAPPVAHARAPPSPSPKAPSQWASRKGRARKRGTGRGGAARGGREGEGGLRLTDGSLQPILLAASPLASVLGSVLRPTFPSSSPPPLRLTPLRPAPPPLPHSAGKSLLERGGGRSGRLVWSLEAELTGARTNRR